MLPLEHPDRIQIAFDDRAIAYWFKYKKRVKVEDNRVMGWVARWGVQ